MREVNSLRDKGRYLDRIRDFDLIQRLSPSAFAALMARSANIFHYAASEVIYTEGQEDNFISYLLEGRVERSRNGALEQVIDYEKDQPTKSLDDTAQKYHTVQAASPVTLVRFTRSELIHDYLDAANQDGKGVLEVTDIGSDSDSDSTEDWRTRLLSSVLFSHLTATSIQSIFDRMIEVQTNQGDEIIHQGDPGGDFYVIQSGSCEVVRHIGSTGEATHLANLGPGEGFGEEAAISGAVRCATVRMSADGSLMRLRKSDFIDLVVTPLVHGVNYREATHLHNEGLLIHDIA